MKYLLEVCGDCNDADYAYSTQVISEEELLRVKEMLESITKVRSAYKKYHPKEYTSWRDNLPYYGNVLESLPEPDMEYENISEEEIEEIDEWLKEVDQSDISNFLEFQETYVPYGTSDNDYVHTIESVKAYKLAEDEPINLL